LAAYFSRFSLSHFSCMLSGFFFSPVEFVQVCVPWTVLISSASLLFCFYGQGILPDFFETGGKVSPSLAFSGWRTTKFDSASLLPLASSDQHFRRLSRVPPRNHGAFSFRTFFPLFFFFPPSCFFCFSNYFLFPFLIFFFFFFFFKSIFFTIEPLKLFSRGSFLSSVVTFALVSFFLYLMIVTLLTLSLCFFSVPPPPNCKCSTTYSFFFLTHNIPPPHSQFSTLCLSH